MKTTVVTTTIYNPTFLRAYAENVAYYGHKDVDFIVVADVKTPAEARDFCKTIPNCTYLGLPEQENYLAKFPELDRHLPFNNIARRNIGHVMAYENGADTVILLDDDNLSTSHDFVKEHETGMGYAIPYYANRSGWFNVCDALVEEHGIRFYARGYPPAQRWNDGAITKQWDCRRVAVNAGLWLNDPDIDAITRLERRLITTDLKHEYTRHFALQPGTWSPWNCQNTSISRAALPSYFLSPYTGRHLDIWASYITTKCAEAMGEVITFGMPLAYHERSPHNLYKDLSEELPWIQATDEFVRVLRKQKTHGITYFEHFNGIYEGLKTDWEHPVKAQMLEGMDAWLNTFSRLGVVKCTNP